MQILTASRSLRIRMGCTSQMTAQISLQDASTRSTKQTSHACPCGSTLFCLQLLCVAAVGEEVQEAEATDDGKRRSKKHKKHHKKEKRERSSRREADPAPAAPPQDRRYVAGMPHERRSICNQSFAIRCGVVMSHAAPLCCCQCTLLQDFFLLA